MTSSHHAPYVLGYKRATLAGTKGCKPVRGSESQKAGPGSDWRLKLASMKAELLVIADQQRRGEYVPGPCTHRPSHHESRQHPKPVAQPARGGVVEGGGGDWGEGVTPLRPLAGKSERHNLACMLATLAVAGGTRSRAAPS